MTALERLSDRHDQWIKGHEDRCAERYEALKDILGEFRDGQKWMVRGVISLIIAVLGYFLVQFADNVLNPGHPAPAHQGASR